MYNQKQKKNKKNKPTQAIESKGNTDEMSYITT